MEEDFSILIDFLKLILTFIYTKIASSIMELTILDYGKQENYLFLTIWT